MKMEPIIIASISLLASVITASLSYYFTKKHQLKIEGRRLKEEYYKSFIKALKHSAMWLLTTRIMKPRRENIQLPRDSNEWATQHDKLLRNVVKEMRQDIFGKEKNIENYLANVHLVGRGPKYK